MILKEQKFHAIQWAPDWSGERYSLIGGEKIPDTLEGLHNSLLDESFTFTQVAEMYGEIYRSCIVKSYIWMVEENVINIRRYFLKSYLYLKNCFCFNLKF